MARKKKRITYQDLFEYLEDELENGTQCDHTLRLTKKFAKQHGLSFGELSQTLEGMGGYCDCEVLANAVDKIPASDTIGQESFKTPQQIAVEQGFFCHDRVDGKPASDQEASRAAQAGLLVKRNVPCSKDDPYAMPDLNRAIIYLIETKKKSPGSK